MPPFRLSFLGRFALVCCAFGACVLGLYYGERALFYAPAPAVPSYDIAPQLTAAQNAQAVLQTRQAAAQQQAEAARNAVKAARQTALAEKGGIRQGAAAHRFFAQADEARGRRIFARCAACHSAAKGGANRVGPNLWGIDGRPVAAHEGFFYSAAMKAFALKQKNWNLAALDIFLSAPAATVPGTIMAYPGVKDLQERADLLLYLASLRDGADAP